MTKKANMKISQEIIEYNDEIIIRIGKNANSNTMMVRIADRSDTWIHVADYSGAHCIIEADIEFSSKRDIPPIIRTCCEQLKSNSKKLRDLHSVKFHITNISNLKIQKNPGEVSFIDMNLVHNVFV